MKLVSFTDTSPAGPGRLSRKGCRCAALVPYLTEVLLTLMVSPSSFLRTECRPRSLNEGHHHLEPEEGLVKRTARRQGDSSSSRGGRESTPLALRRRDSAHSTPLLLVFGRSWLYHREVTCASERRTLSLSFIFCKIPYDFFVKLNVILRND